MLIMALSIASLLWYGSFIFDISHMGHPVAYALLLLAELIGMSQLLGTWFSILIPPKSPLTPQVAHLQRELLSKQRKRLPMSVVVFVPVAGEPLEMIRETIVAARDIRLAHRTVVLDDGGLEAVRTLTEELGVEYLRRPQPDGKKAGNINYGLSQVQSDLFVIFDSDHVPHPDFLLHTIPYLLADERLAFVQTPQYFSNRQGFISGGAAEAQEVFYRYIQPGKNPFSAAFCVGTNVVFRRTAIDEIGGIYTKSNSEDIWTSLLLHERGWRSLFLPTVLAVGQAPERLDQYFRQQFRWARGGLEIFFTHNPLWRPLTTDQKLQYLYTTSHYLTGFSALIFFILPLLYVYFGWKPLNAPEGLVFWAVRFLPYYILIFLSTIHLLGRVPKWRTFVVALTAFSAHIGACVAVLTGRNIRWSATGAINSRFDYVKSVAVHLLLLLLSVGAVPALLITSDAQPLAPLMVVWLLMNSSVLFSICVRAVWPLAKKPADAWSEAYGAVA